MGRGGVTGGASEENGLAQVPKIKGAGDFFLVQFHQNELVVPHFAGPHPDCVGHRLLVPRLPGRGLPLRGPLILQQCRTGSSLEAVLRLPPFLQIPAEFARGIDAQAEGQVDDGLVQPGHGVGVDEPALVEPQMAPVLLLNHQKIVFFLWKRMQPNVL